MGLPISFVCLLCLFSLHVNTNEFTTASNSYKPVVIVHGIWDKNTSLDFLANRIRQVCLKLDLKEYVLK